MPTPTPLTQIDLQELQLAHTAFSDAVQTLQPIATDVRDYPTRIANVALQSAAGANYANAIDDWVANFRALWTVLGQITDQIEAQITAMKKINDVNTGLAATTTG